MSEIIFQHILQELGQIASKSRIMTDQQKLNKKWAYSVCATPIQQKAPIIMGINWGGGANGETFTPQKEMPTKEVFLEQLNKGEYNFLKRSGKYLSDHAGINIEEANFTYTNLCFFRTPRATDLTTEDYRLSFDVFKKLVELVHPTQIICFGTSVFRYLHHEFNVLSSVSVCKVGRAKGYRGMLLGFPFYCIPHPNAHLRSNDRDMIWHNVFQEKQQTLP